MRTFGIRLMILLGCFLLGCSVLACQGSKDSYVLKIDYIENLAAEIGDVTAIGIANLPIEDLQKLSHRSGDVSIYDIAQKLFSPEFLAQSTGGKDIETKNYLITTREDYFHGKTEFDDSGITKVTFIKNTTVTETVRDHKGNIISETDTVTQDELPAQVNKVYVYNNMTFLQFIPVTPNNEGVLSNDGYQMVDIRPDNLKIEEDGSTAFDKIDYRTNEFHQSFVIDNQTGYIYKIDDIWIIQLHNGLCKIRPEESQEVDPQPDTIYDYRINEDNRLEFFTLIQNPTVNVYEYFKDIHGNNFIQTNSLELYDSATKTYFFKWDFFEGSGPTVDDFVFTDQRVVLRRMDQYQYKKVASDGTFEALTSEDTLSAGGMIRIKNGLQIIHPSSKVTSWSVNHSIHLTQLSTNYSVSISVFYHSNLTHDEYYILSHDVLLFRNDLAMYWCKLDYSGINYEALNGKLIYFPNIISYGPGGFITNPQGSYDGSENYPVQTMTSGWNMIFIGFGYEPVASNLFRYQLIGLTQTRYFELVRVYNDDGFTLSWVERESINAGETVRYFFQPINPNN